MSNGGGLDGDSNNADEIEKNTTMYGSYVNPYAAIGNTSGQINLNTIAPVFGVPSSGIAQQGKVKQPDYLYYDQRGRGLFERTNYNVGASCLVGMLVGGTYGLVDGWRTSPSTKWKIRLNSVLNKSGRHGSRLGNALGVLALFYSGTEYGLEQAEIERTLGGLASELVIPTTAAIASGILYKSTSGSPKAMLLAGAIGGSLALGAYGLKSIGIQSSKGLLFF